MIELPEPVDPLVSVLMVTHGAWHWADRALHALVAHTDEPFELIVVDNDSPDQTPDRLAELGGARVIYNDENRGFGSANNQAATHARGELILLLNTDALVHPGWLPPLLESIADPSVGAVVPRYLHLDGRLQEAGALLARDGSVVTYGDGDDPERLVYRFRRLVDFGGAACMLMRRNTFVDAGGFDPVYAPAYYEDVDLCLRLAAGGLSTVYEPRSLVTHVRHASGGTAAAIRASRRNQEVFVDHWQPRLAGRPWTFQGVSEQAVVAARDALATPRVLVYQDGITADRLVRWLIETWPAGRVSWTAGVSRAPGPDLEGWLHDGVELIDDPTWDWLEDRRFHYDLAVLESDPPQELLVALDATQPQAARVGLDELDNLLGASWSEAAALEVLSKAGIAPPWERPRAA